MVKSLFAAAVAAGFAIASGAQAAPILLTGGTLDASAATSNAAPFVLGDFGSSSTPGLQSTGTIQIANGGTITFSPNNNTPQAGVYSGTTSNVARSPYPMSTTANYLVAEPNDPVRINLNTTQNSFSLLWGSVDAYNDLRLDFSGRNGTTTAIISGSDVAASAGIVANGSTSAYVTFTTNIGFDRVIARSSTSAFEFNPSVQVPEPASLALLGAGLAGIGFVRRKKATTAA